MLGVVVHVPVPELNKRVVDVECSSGQSKVFDDATAVSAKLAVVQSDVLGAVAQPEQPPVVERSKREQEWSQQRPSCRDRSIVHQAVVIWSTKHLERTDFSKGAIVVAVQASCHSWTIACQK